MDRISEQLQQLAASLRPTQEELSRMQEAFGAVQQLLMQHFPQCKVWLEIQL
jgi:prefoldin subunit 5